MCRGGLAQLCSAGQESSQGLPGAHGKPVTKQPLEGEGRGVHSPRSAWCYQERTWGPGTALAPGGLGATWG